MPKKITNYIDHFWSRIDTSNPEACWVFPGAKTSFGYGVQNIHRKPTLAHRLAWESVNGTIPDGMFVCHKCDNPSCCNPRHLFLGTQADNMADARMKMRIQVGEENDHSILTEKQVREILSLANSDITRIEIAKRYGVSRQIISQIISGARWSHIERHETPDDRTQGIHHPFAKLNNQKAKEIRKLYKMGHSQRQLAKQFNVSRGTIDALLKNKTWKEA